MLDIAVQIGACEDSLTSEEFTKNVIEPAMFELARKISKYKSGVSFIDCAQLVEANLPHGELCASATIDGVSVFVREWFNPKELRKNFSVVVMLFETGSESGYRVFLGGTCNKSTWREALIEELNIGYFNPVVEDWTPECMAEEIRQRETCDFCLYTITPRMTGCYSIAEVVDDSNKRPEKTIFCITQYDVDFSSPEDTITYDEHMKKSLGQVAKMVEENGSIVFQTLKDVATYLNSYE